MNQATVLRILDILETELKSLEAVGHGSHADKITKDYTHANANGIKYAIKTIKSQMRKE